MADTIQNIVIPSGEWVDLYALSGVTVGTAISIQNIGVCDVYLAVRETQPPLTYDAYNIIQRKNGFWLRNSQGDSGAWGFCAHSGGKVNIRELS